MKLKDELMKAEPTDQVIYKMIQIINDIEQYLLGNSYFIIKQ